MCSKSRGVALGNGATGAIGNSRNVEKQEGWRAARLRGCPDGADEGNAAKVQPEIRLDDGALQDTDSQASAKRQRHRFPVTSSVKKAQTR